MDSQSNNKSSRDNASHDRQKAKDVRLSNISASKAVADAVRTSLGPRGLDKMVQEEGGDVFISNDGATILSKMRVEHPAAKMLVDLSKAQDVEAGDGTTTVVVIAGSLLSASLTLLGKGIHPSVISDAFQFAVEKAEEILERAAQPVDVNDRAAVVQAAATALSSKVVSQHAALLAPIAVEAVTRISNLDQPDSIDLRNIRVVKKLGGTLDDTELFDGLVLNQHANKSAGGVTKVTGAKVALIQFCLSAPKTDIENNVIVQDYSAMDRVLREERQYILNLCKKIKVCIGS
jgi:T-complex protein 1 subunit delta